MNVTCPLPVDCPISDYTADFARLCGLFARRNRWKIARQCPHVDVDDIAQDAVVLMLNDPAKYATEPLDAGASMAVNDVVREHQGGPSRRQRQFSALDEMFPQSVQAVPDDYETQADSLIPFVGAALSIPAALVAADIDYRSAWEAIGVSKSAFYVRRGKIVERLYSLAFPVKTQSGSAGR